VYGEATARRGRGSFDLVKLTGATFADGRGELDGREPRAFSPCASRR